MPYVQDGYVVAGYVAGTGTGSGSSDGGGSATTGASSRLRFDVKHTSAKTDAEIATYVNSIIEDMQATIGTSSIVYGDVYDPRNGTIKRFYSAFAKANGFNVESVVFGSGGALDSNSVVDIVNGMTTIAKSSELQSVQSAINGVASTANSALAQSQSAISASQSAVNNSATAVESASEAVLSASNALTTAGQAVSSSATANTTANQALELVNNAVRPSFRLVTPFDLVELDTTLVGVNGTYAHTFDTGVIGNGEYHLEVEFVSE